MRNQPALSRYICGRLAELFPTEIGQQVYGPCDWVYVDQAEVPVHYEPGQTGKAVWCPDEGTLVELLRKLYPSEELYVSANSDRVLAELVPADTSQARQVTMPTFLEALAALLLARGR